MEKDVPFEAERADAFPVVVDGRPLSASEQKDLGAFSEALLPLKRNVSPAEIEQVLLDCRKDEVGWLRGCGA